MSSEDTQLSRRDLLKIGGKLLVGGGLASWLKADSVLVGTDAKQKVNPEELVLDANEQRILDQQLIEALWKNDAEKSKVVVELLPHWLMNGAKIDSIKLLGKSSEDVLKITCLDNSQDNLQPVANKFKKSDAAEKDWRIELNGTDTILVSLADTFAAKLNGRDNISRHKLASMLYQGGNAYLQSLLGGTGFGDYGLSVGFAVEWDLEEKRSSMVEQMIVMIEKYKTKDFDTDLDELKDGKFGFSWNMTVRNRSCMLIQSCMFDKLTRLSGKSVSAFFSGQNVSMNIAIPKHYDSITHGIAWSEDEGVSADMKDEEQSKVNDTDYLELIRLGYRLVLGEGDREKRPVQI